MLRNFWRDWFNVLTVATWNGKFIDKLGFVIELGKSIGNKWGKNVRLIIGFELIWSYSWIIINKF